MAARGFLVRHVAYFAIYRASSKIVVGQTGQTFQAQLGSDVDRFTATMRTNLFGSNIVAQTVISDFGLDTMLEALLCDRCCCPA